MLTVRTNLLLDKKTHNLLKHKAKQEKKTMGELIRKAIIKTYKEDEDEIIRQRTEAVKKIKELQKRMKPLKGITIRELIDYGRYR